MSQDLKGRTKRFAIEIIRWVDTFPSKQSAWIVGKQVVRSATSIGANYRTACRAKSNADFINKLKIVEEEADETMYWLEIIKEVNLTGDDPYITTLLKESNEIVAIIVSSIKTARNRPG
ncbi:MAG: four helix bundle protein [Saprospiraceae bacterium]